MRVFLDANILFSAAKSDGAVRRLLDLLLDAGHECWADGYVVEESRRNLAVKAPDNLSVLDALLSRLNVADIHPGAIEFKPALALPEKDRPVLAAAIRLKCEALLTGDKSHFGALYGKSPGGVAIHSPRTLADALLP